MTAGCLACSRDRPDVTVTTSESGTIPEPYLSTRVRLARPRDVVGKSSCCYPHCELRPRPVIFARSENPVGHVRKSVALYYYRL